MVHKRPQVPLPISEGTRDILNGSRDLTTDSEGQEVFVGLSRSESEEYVTLTELDDDMSIDARDRYLELDAKKNRFKFLGAEYELRSKPVKH